MNRENLIKALWPNTVVEEANLNVHISALRKILAEGPDEQRYIETLPRLGYRFIAPVMELEPSEKSETESTPAVTPIENLEITSPPPAPADTILENTHQEIIIPASRRSRLTAAITLGSLALAIAAVAIFLMVRKTDFFKASSDPNTPLNIVPLTTYAGRESHPAFSPDGNQVAFVWSGEKEDNQDIYVRLIEPGNLVRLTTNPGDDLNPTWSPDGRTIAFYRNAPEGNGVYLIPMLGGAERKLTDAWANRFGFGAHSWIQWSPTGKTIALSDKSSADESFSLNLISIETGERRRITAPPPSIIGDCSPAFSPDGKMLAFVRVNSAVVGEVYLMSIEGGEPRRLTFEGLGVTNVAWSPDGQEIVFSMRQGGRSRLFRIPVEGGSPQWIAAAGNDTEYPTFSRQGNRLAWRENTDHADIYQLPLKGSPEEAGAAVKLIASTANEASPRYSPDGRRIAFTSNRSGSEEIWVAGSDGRNPTRLTSFRGPLAGSPNWSPDGKQIVFDCRPDGNADIYAVNSDGGPPRRLTTDAGEDIVPSWSHDGRWIYFTSNRGGRLQVWKLPSDGGEAAQVTKGGGFEPTESANGQWIYFTQDRGSTSIWRIPVAGGDESLVYDFRQPNHSRLWTINADGVFFGVADPSLRSQFKFYSFSNGSLRTVAETDFSLPGPGVSGLTVSPDGGFLLFPSIAQRGSDLMMIENFR